MTNGKMIDLNGSKNTQVLPEINLSAIETHLKTAKNKDVTIKELEGFNHLFQTAETGNVLEYGTIEETFPPKVLVIIKDWIKTRF